VSAPVDRRALAARMPDVPRWVEARAFLLWERCAVFGAPDPQAPAFALWDAPTSSLIVYGRPSPDVVREAAACSAGEASAVCAPEDADWLAALLPGWARSRAILHALRDAARLPAPDDGDVRLLDPRAIASLDVPDELRAELRVGAERSPIAASFVDGAPMAFCYAGAITETLWDVAIDTLEAHRRQGHAARCAARMIRDFRARGLDAVWASDAANPPSWMLARRLGFAAVDEVALFEQG
jgi:GNAT superfamily N-acetyltransferase